MLSLLFLLGLPLNLLYSLGKPGLPRPASSSLRLSVGNLFSPRLRFSCPEAVLAAGR